MDVSEVYSKMTRKAEQLGVRVFVYCGTRTNSVIGAVLTNGRKMRSSQRHNYEQTVGFAQQKCKRPHALGYRFGSTGELPPSSYDS